MNWKKRCGNHMSDITPILGAFYEAAGYIGIAYIQMLACPGQNINLCQPQGFSHLKTRMVIHPLCSSLQKCHIPSSLSIYLPLSGTPSQSDFTQLPPTYHSSLSVDVTSSRKPSLSSTPIVVECLFPMSPC